MTTTARAWLTRRGARDRASLDLALLGAAGFRYVVARVGLIGARAILRTAIHAAELTFLVRQFPMEFIAPLFAMRALPALLSGLHWGALETLRTRVRREVASRNPVVATLTTEGYLCVAGAMGVALLVAVGLALSRIDDLLAGPLGLYGSFAIACAFALAIELWTRTYHAGVYALGRVYRPTWLLVAPDFVELGGILLLFAEIGPFALHAIVLASAVLRGIAAVFYARRAYRVRGLQLPHPWRLRSLRRLGARDGVDAVRHTLATLPSQLDRLLLLALLNAPPPSDAIALAGPYYALRPIAGFAQSWVRGFYADFVQLDIAGVGLLRARFERLLAKAAVVTGALAALVLMTSAYALFGAAGAMAGAWLAPLVLLRSRFALDQMRGFAYGAERELAGTGVVLLSGAALAQLGHWDDRVVLVVFALTLLAALLISRRIASRAEQRRAHRVSRMPLSAWLHALAVRTSPTQVVAARVDNRITSTAAALRAVAAKLETSGNVTRFGRAWLLWYEPREPARPALRWVCELGGALAELRSTEADDGAEALARRESYFPSELSIALAASGAADRVPALRAQAARLVPSVDTIELHRSSRVLDTLGATRLALVRRAVLSSAREHQTPPRRSPFQVAVYAPRGEPELVFLWPTGAKHGGALQRLAQEASWRASLEAVSKAEAARSSRAV